MYWSIQYDIMDVSNCIEGTAIREPSDHWPIPTPPVWSGSLWLPCYQAALWYLCGYAWTSLLYTREIAHDFFLVIEIVTFTMLIKEFSFFMLWNMHLPVLWQERSHLCPFYSKNHCTNKMGRKGQKYKPTIVMHFKIKTSGANPMEIQS